jgi:hypothetical protein
MANGPTISATISAAFAAARIKYHPLHLLWRDVSIRIGSHLPNSRLTISVQRVGDLDLLIRAMESEFSPTTDLIDAHHNQLTLSELWVSSTYEIMRVIRARKLGPENGDLPGIAQQLKLLRIPMDKYEIADDKKLPAPLRMQTQPDELGTISEHVYDKGDASRSHVLPVTISERGSAMWYVIDGASQSAQWIERVGLADRILDAFSN